LLLKGKTTMKPENKSIPIVGKFSPEKFLWARIKPSKKRKHKKHLTMGDIMKQTEIFAASLREK